MHTLHMHVNIVLTSMVTTRPLYDVMFMNMIKCGYYSRAALISLSSLEMRLLFEGGYYLGCSFYSNKYGIHVVSFGSDGDSRLLKAMQIASALKSPK